MSALPQDIEAEERRPALTLLPAMPSRISTLGFIAFLGVVLALGLTAVMITSTTVAAQSRELDSLRREAQVLSYESAALTSELQSLASTSSLAMRAADLGMVPNPYPAFINLEDATIMGDPTPVRGNETPWLRVVPNSGPSVVTHDAAPGVPGTNLPYQEGQRGDQ